VTKSLKTIKRNFIMKAQEVKSQAESFGADLIGIASIDRFAGVPAEKNPLSIFPECKSVIILGRRVLRGALRGVEEGTNFGSTYGAFGHGWLEDNFISKTTYDLTCWFEEQGCEAVPLFAYSPDVDMSFGEPVAPNKPAPNVIIDIDYAAHNAGLGSLGKSGTFLTPKYGPRQRFATILTDIELEADPVIDLDFCDDCNACIEGCPLNAFTNAKRDKKICSSCNNGAFDTRGRGGEKDRIAAACGRACVISLEKRNKLSNSFDQPFRKRQPWALDVYNRSI
jgi:epoxyqueuosine reductase